MASSPENNTLIKDVAKKAAGGFDNGVQGARAVINEYQNLSAYDMGKNDLPLEEAIKKYGDTEAVRKDYENGKGFANKSASERALIQKSMQNK